MISDAKKPITLESICEKYGLTEEGVDYALSQYGTVICEITKGLLSKLTYSAEYIIQTAQERWCDTCDLKDIEAEPVRHGHWIWIGGYGYQHRCSECVMCVPHKSSWCPHCGAKMDEVSE